ncbi:MAG: chromate efflux transporter [Armatimonadota bacterium]
MPGQHGSSESRQTRVPFWDACRFWLLLGFINFGGPTGQIAIMHQELVDRRRWISDARFFHALNYCMLLPGPEAQQLATYVGWLLHRTAGGLVAGTLFVLPAFFVLLGLSWLYAVHGTVPWIAAIFYGLRAGVIAIVAAAVIRIGRRALKHPVLIAIALGAFAALFLFGAPFPLIVLGAGVIGLIGTRLWPAAFGRSEAPGLTAHGERGSENVIGDETPSPDHARPTVRGILTVLAACLAAWWVPLAAVIVWRGPDDVLGQMAIFFSKAAMVTFGGAYAVLAYIAQAAVQHYEWVTTPDMLVGLGLAESTPGPLILVTEFVGFLGAFRHPGGLDPVVAGTLGAAVTVWATFAPSFLWIFVGAPFIEQLRGNTYLTGALSAITAAVVGVILNLALWFAFHTLFGAVVEIPSRWTTITLPVLATVDWSAVLIAAIAFAGMWRLNWGIIPVVIGSAIAGWILRAFP